MSEPLKKNAASKPRSHQTFLATWNPAHWTWDERDDQIAATESGFVVMEPWSTGSRKGGIAPGDDFLLLEQGTGPRGIIGVGSAIADPDSDSEQCVYEDDHWDFDRAAQGETAFFVDIAWRLLLDDANRIPVEELIANHGKKDWNNIMSSGQQLDASVAEALLDRLDDLEPIAPEVSQARQAVQTAAGKNRGGQGFGLSKGQRDAVERRSMELVHDHLTALGWDDIVDTSIGNSYDFYCAKDDESELFVEVKGTTSAGETVILTRNEVETHRAEHPHNALIVVSEIRLDGKNREQASGGTVTMHSPWLIKDNALRVIGYTYSTSDL